MCRQSSRIRILMVCPQFRPLTGGYERAAERLSIALVSRGHDVTVITERRDRAWAHREVMAGVHIRRLWCIYRGGLHALTSLLSLAAWLLFRGRRFSVWHVHQYGAHATVAVLLGKVLRRPVVLKLTSSGEQGLSAALEKLCLPLLHRWAHRRVQACLAVSEETLSEAKTFGVPRRRIHAIGNGVDPALLRPADRCEREAARQALGLGSGFVAVAVGRLAIEKNPVGLINAWAKALQRLPLGAQLVWIGGGPMHPEVSTCLDRLGLNQSVRLAGHSDDVPRWLRAADAFLLSSRNEGMANTMLEAMACGLPCAATAVSGTRQLLSKTGAGIVVPVGDMEALADAIVVLAADSMARQRMGEQARQTILDDYSLDIVTSRLEQVYKAVPHGM